MFNKTQTLIFNLIGIQCLVKSLHPRNTPCVSESKVQNQPGLLKTAQIRESESFLLNDDLEFTLQCLANNINM